MAVGLMLLIVVAAIPYSSGASVPATVSITLGNNGIGSPNDTISVSGSGFATSSALSISTLTQGASVSFVGSVSTTNTGSFSATATVVDMSMANGNTITVTDASSNSASATYTAECFGGTCGMSISPVSGASTNQVTLNGVGYYPSSAVTVSSSTGTATFPSGCSADSQGQLYNCVVQLTGLATGNNNVKVTDTKGSTSHATYTVTTAGPTVSMFSAGPATIQIGASTTFSVIATGGVTPYSYSYVSLPPGCASANTNTLPCTPTAIGSYTVEVILSDANSQYGFANTSLVVSSSAPRGSPNITAVKVNPATITVGTDTSTLFIVAITCNAIGCPTYSLGWVVTPTAMGGASLGCNGVSPCNAVYFISGPHNDTGSLALTVTWNVTQSLTTTATITVSGNGSGVGSNSTTTIAGIGIVPLIEILAVASVVLATLVLVWRSRGRQIGRKLAGGNVSRASSKRK